MPKMFPSGYNTFVPNTDATNNLVIDFSRNPREFALPGYVQYVKVDKNVGLYIEMTIEQAGRVLADDGADYAWPYGDPAPSGKGHRESFEFKPYKTQRFAPTDSYPQEAPEQADWPLLAQASRHNAQVAMTLRTMRTLNVLLNESAYPTGHVEDVVDIEGVTGFLDESTVNRSDIKRALDHMADQIKMQTLGSVKGHQLVAVMNPTVARQLSVTQELRDYLKQSPAAKETLVGNLGPLAQFGFPETLYDYRIVVEDAVRVPTRKGASTVQKNYVLGDDVILMLSRPGGLEGIDGAPSFSTATLFMKEELTVESKHDTDNRLEWTRVVDDFAPVLTAPLAGALIKNPLSSSSSAA